ncbi:MAG: hypothetical protein VB102_03760 [Paludibacter sp.]|nr:hypothetical protein [Paludibacter sp.]
MQKINAQLSSFIYVETGENYVSSGMYTDITGNISAKINRWELGITSGLTFSEARQDRFNALSIDLSRSFKLKELSFDGKLFYQWRPFSERLHEQNAGLLIAYKKNWFGLEMGLNTRIYYLTDRVISLNNYQQTTIWEPLNLMYKFTYFAPFSEKIHFRASITNYDTFIIQQETNPMIIIKLDYQLSQSTKLNLGVGYLQSGLMNIRVNYFGYFIRGGVQWEL